MNKRPVMTIRYSEPVPFWELKVGDVFESQGCILMKVFCGAIQPTVCNVVTLSNGKLSSFPDETLVIKKECVLHIL
jgi:hypothetical protein